MTDLLRYESAIRLGCFSRRPAGDDAMGMATTAPDAEPARARRWPANLGIIVVDSMVLRLVFPVLAVGVAGWPRRGAGVYFTG
jgi:hypothetical protein